MELCDFIFFIKKIRRMWFIHKRLTYMLWIDKLKYILMISNHENPAKDKEYYRVKRIQNFAYSTQERVTNTH